MTATIDNATLDIAVSRRELVQGMAGLTFAFSFGAALLGKPSEAFAADSARLNAYVTVAADNSITILCPTSEMGTVLTESICVAMRMPSAEKRSW